MLVLNDSLGRTLWYFWLCLTCCVDFASWEQGRAHLKSLTTKSCVHISILPHACFLRFILCRHAEKSRVRPKLQRSKSHERFKSQFCSSWWNARKSKKIVSVPFRDWQRNLKNCPNLTISVDEMEESRKRLNQSHFFGTDKKLGKLSQLHNFPSFFFSLLRLRWCRHV